MSSAIDSSKPAEGTPAEKADLRANLETARIELNHGGFTALSPSNYGPPAGDRVEDHLAAIDNALGSGGAIGAFTDLNDTPSVYAGEASKFVKVRSDEAGLEFVTSGGATNADAVSYDPPWADVVTRSVEARLMDEAHVEDFGAVGDGTADDAAAIQAAVDSPAAFIVFGPQTYSVGTRIDVPQGKVLVFKGATITGHPNLPTTGDASALFFFDGSAPTSRRGNGIFGMVDIQTGGRALYGISVGSGSSRFDAYGMPIVFQAGFSRCVRMVQGGWYNFRLRGMFANSVADGGVAFDLQDLNGTTIYLEGISVGLTGGSGKTGFRLEAETIQMDTCSVDQASADAPAIELVSNHIGSQVTANNLHLEGNHGTLIKLDAATNVQFYWNGGLFHAPDDNTGTMLDVGSGAILVLRDVRYRAFTNWTTFANVGSGGIVKVYEGTRDLSAGSPWNQFTGSGEAFQIWKGKRINLHNSP